MVLHKRSVDHSYTLAKSEDAISEKEDNFKPKREISLISSVAYIAGGVIGSGIFIAPKGVLQYSGSIGYSLILWAAAGLFSLIGCFCYVELGITFPKSGGAYIYIKEAFGDLTAFIYIWVETFSRRPTAAALGCIVFAKYAIQPFFEGGCIPEGLLSERLLAACMLCIITYFNCLYVGYGIALQVIMTILKLFSLGLIIILGLIVLGKGSTQNFDDAFSKSPESAADVIFALYAGLWAYSGWDSINTSVEEVKNPKKTIPRSIYISIFIITIVYLLTNVAYMAVLTKDEILEVDAIAVTFSQQTMGKFRAVMPIMVAISAIGTLNSMTFTSSRILFSAAREKQLPSVLSMINTKYLTPQPALILNAFLSMLVLLGGGFLNILNYYSFIRWATVGVSVFAQLWLRWKRPDIPRPIKFSIIFPVIFTISCVILVVIPFYKQPVNCCIGIGLALIGVPLYFFFLGWKNKPHCFTNKQDKFTIFCQKLLMIAPTEEKLE